MHNIVYFHWLSDSCHVCVNSKFTVHSFVFDLGGLTSLERQGLKSFSIIFSKPWICQCQVNVGSSLAIISGMRVHAQHVRTTPGWREVRYKHGQP